MSDLVPEEDCGGFESLYAAIAHRSLVQQRVFALETCRFETPALNGTGHDAQFCWRASGRSSTHIANIQPDAGVREVSLSVSGGRPGAIIPAEAYGTVTGVLQDGARLSMRRVWVTNESMSPFTFGISKVEFSFDHFRIDHGEARPPRYYRLVFGNARFRLWPDVTNFRSTQGHWSKVDAVTFSFQGSTLRLTQIQKKPGLCVLILDSSPLDEHGARFVRAITVLLTFLMGVRVDAVALEAYDDRGGLIYEELYPQSKEAAAPFYPPIDWQGDLDGRPYSAEMSSVLTSLLAQFFELDRKLFLTEVVGFILSSYGTYPEVAFALRSVALDSMANAYKRHYQTAWDATLMEEPEFVAVADELKSKLQGLLSAPDRQDHLQRLMGKIDGLNQTGNTHSFILFVKTMGLEVTKREKRLFGLRSNVIHNGALQFERDSLDHQELVTRLGEMIFVVNFCFLRLLGYQGLIVDYGKIGFPSTWIGPPRGVAGAV